MWSSALATSLLLVSQLSGGVLGGEPVRIYGRNNKLERDMRAYAEVVVERGVERRQSTTPMSNSTSWDSQTSAACISALTKLNGVASNPAGMAVCYNIPYLDTSTSIFQADLRLYMISQPTGAFASVPAQNVTVALQYFGTEVQIINPDELMWPIEAQGDVEKRQNMVPAVTQKYAFKGQIKQGSTSNMTKATLEGLLTPVVTLSASTDSGTVVNTTLASNEATFITGVFSKAINNAGAASASASLQTDPLQFYVPGTQILIFPIGGIITGAWAAIFIATIGYGTVGRIRFRDSYRRRLAWAQKRRIARI